MSCIKTMLLSYIFLIFTAFPTYAQVNTLQAHIDKYCKRNCVSAEKLMSVATKAAKSYKFDVAAVLAIVHVESKFHIRAKNGSSVGLSQVLLRYHKPKFKGTNYFDVEDNVFAGMQVFSDCLRKQKGDYKKAFGCYNGGGDRSYGTKASAAYVSMKGIVKPSVDEDPLGTFITAVLD